MKLDTNVQPLEINVSFDTFVNVYRSAMQHKETDCINQLIKIMIYAFQPWVKSWETKDYKANINIFTLINLIKADDKPKGTLSWKIKTYSDYLEFNNITFQDELLYCLAQHINKPKIIYREYFRSKNLLFFIAKDIKMFLFKKIRKVLAANIRNNNYLLPLPDETSYYDSYMDLLYLENYPLHNNVLLLILNNSTAEQIRSTLNLSRLQYKDIYKCLSQNLKQLNK